MSNEEAIKWLKSIKEKIHGGDDWFDEHRKDAIDRAVEALEETKPSGAYQCFHCLEKAVIWDNDFTFEDYGIEDDEGRNGIVHVCHCANCGAEIEYMVPIEKEGEQNECE